VVVFCSDRFNFMIPRSDGVWRWKRKDDDREFDLPVFNVVNECFSVYFLGSYYDVDREMTGGEWIAKVSHNPYSVITKQIRGWIHPDDWKA
jgi:hypothetical protein